MIQVILTRLESTHRNLRTSEVVGETNELPQKGRTFRMVGAPLDKKADFRVVSTTPIRETRHHVEEGSLEFWTENSHYGLQILDMDTEGGVN